jgi:hypothetical protein
MPTDRAIRRASQRLLARDRLVQDQKVEEETMPDTRPTTPLANAGRLASYLTVGVTGSLLANAHSEAAIVMIDLTNVAGNDITGANAGLPAVNGKISIVNWLGAGSGTLEIYNNYSGYWGLDGDSYSSNTLQFAVNGSSSSFASPRNFGTGTTIDNSATWTGSANRTTFKYVTSSTFTSPDFGASSFMGFRFGSGSYYYGYLEVTWNSTTNTFQILSGAYESTANTGILAGATPSAVPGGGVSAMALMALGGGAFRRRSRGRVA